MSWNSGWFHDDPRYFRSARTGEGDDVRGTQERDSWKEYASDTSAAFTVGLISGGLSVQPLVAKSQTLATSSPKAVDKKVGFEAYKSTVSNFSHTDSIPPQIGRIPSIDLNILRAINDASSSSFVSPIPVCSSLNIDPQEIADRLEILKKYEYIDVVFGAYVQGISLPNGIYNIRLTALGRQKIRETPFVIKTEPKNDAKNIPRDQKTLTIIFDRGMKGNVSINGDENGYFDMNNAHIEHEPESSVFIVTRANSDQLLPPNAKITLVINPVGSLFPFMDQEGHNAQENKIISFVTGIE